MFFGDLQNDHVPHSLIMHKVSHLLEAQNCVHSTFFMSLIFFMSLYILFLLKCSTFPLAVTNSCKFSFRNGFKPHRASLIPTETIFLFREGNDTQHPMLIRNLLPIPGVRLWFNQQPRRPSHLLHAA